jgi:hypothetical protein
MNKREIRVLRLDRGKNFADDLTHRIFYGFELQVMQIEAYESK